jgi:hypothetical protein
MLTFYHFLSLSVTFCHFWTNFWNVPQACFLHTNASAWHCDTAFKLFFIKTFVDTTRCEGSLFVTFYHFLSLLDQPLECVTSLFFAHQCLCMAFEKQLSQAVTFCHFALFWSLSNK